MTRMHDDDIFVDPAPIDAVRAGGLEMQLERGGLSKQIQYQISETVVATLAIGF